MGGDDFAVPVTWFTNPFFFPCKAPKLFEWYGSLSHRSAKIILKKWSCKIENNNPWATDNERQTVTSICSFKFVDSTILKSQMCTDWS